MRYSVQENLERKLDDARDDLYDSASEDKP